MHAWKPLHFFSQWLFITDHSIKISCDPSCNTIVLLFHTNVPDNPGGNAVPPRIHTTKRLDLTLTMPAISPFEALHSVHHGFPAHNQRNGLPIVKTNAVRATDCKPQYSLEICFFHLVDSLLLTASENMSG